MTIHTKVSKLIGHDQHSVPWPTKQEAQQHLENVCSSEYHYQRVFEFHRFHASGTNQEQYEIQDIMYQAWMKGQQYWSQIEEKEV